MNNAKLTSAATLFCSLITVVKIAIVQFRKDPYPHHAGNWKFHRDGGGVNLPDVQEGQDAFSHTNTVFFVWKFQRGGGSFGQFPPWWGCVSFWNSTLVKYSSSYYNTY